MKYLRLFAVGLAGALLGAALLFGYFKARPDTARSLFAGREQSILPSSDSRTHPWDPFTDARRMQEEIEKEMQSGAGFGFEMGAEQQVVAKEDEKSVSYEISGVDATKLSASVRDGYLTLTGEANKKVGGATVQSSFQQSFPLPRNVDTAKMETSSEGDKVILRFPKRRNG
jgi:HSP20 family molecular chaperone IbpA